MRVAAAIVLTDEERTAQMKWALGRSTEARLVLQAKIELAAADGGVLTIGAVPAPISQFCGATSRSKVKRECDVAHSKKPGCLCSRAKGERCDRRSG